MRTNQRMVQGLLSAPPKAGGGAMNAAMAGARGAMPPNMGGAMAGAFQGMQQQPMQRLSPGVYRNQQGGLQQSRNVQMPQQRPPRMPPNMGGAFENMPPAQGLPPSAFGTLYPEEQMTNQQSGYSAGGGIKGQPYPEGNMRKPQLPDETGYLPSGPFQGQGQGAWQTSGPFQGRGQGAWQSFNNGQMQGAPNMPYAMNPYMKFGGSY